MAQRGKRYLELVKLVDHERKYTINEVVHLIKETAKANFDQTIEIHFRLADRLDHKPNHSPSAHPRGPAMEW